MDKNNEIAVTRPSKTIIIIDDHRVFREGLRSILSQTSEFKVVGEAGSRAEGRKVAMALSPDLCIVDIELPDDSGIELTRELKDLTPDARVLMLSMHSKMEYISEAFHAGAMGYVLKESASKTLLSGLGSLSRNKPFLDPAASRGAISWLMRYIPANEAVNDCAFNSLTSRERTIMRLLAEGLRSREIACHLFISPRTVENHRHSILQKLQLRNSFEVLRYAARIGLVDVELWKN